MKLNKEYKQIFAHNLKNYEALNGKIVDKVAFSNRGSHDENIFIILFTDKTYIALGTQYRDIDAKDEEPQLTEFWVKNPACLNGGNFEYHSWIDRKTNEIHFDPWITFLKDFGIWNITEDEIKDIIKKDKEKEEEREYQQYLRLKEKFESKNEQNVFNTEKP